MRKETLAFAACGGVLCGVSAATAAEHEEALAAVPSGLALSVQEQMVQEMPDGTNWARFRFVAPGLQTGVSYAQVADDFAFLCEEIALPEILSAPDKVSKVVISFASQPVEFGSTRPDVVQYFEAFDVQTDRCIWEAF